MILFGFFVGTKVIIYPLYWIEFWIEFIYATIENDVSTLVILRTKKPDFLQYFLLTAIVQTNVQQGGRILQQLAANDDAFFHELLFFGIQQFGQCGDGENMVLVDDFL